jgi:hypothetical protein
MRRRRLKKTRRQHFEDVAREIEQREIDLYRSGQISWEQAQDRIFVALDAAKKAYFAAAAHRNLPHDVRDEIFNEGYQHCAQQYMRQHQQMLAQARAAGARDAQVDMERAIMGARTSAYQQGLQEGLRQSKMQASTTSRSSDGYKKLFEDLEEEMNVIGQSNPNMEPAMKALRHRLKKKQKK